jgi:hypothetical protein
MKYTGYFVYGTRADRTAIPIASGNNLTVVRKSLGEIAFKALGKIKNMSDEERRQIVYDIRHTSGVMDEKRIVYTVIDENKNIYQKIYMREVDALDFVINPDRKPYAIVNLFDENGGIRYDEDYGWIIK